MQSLEKHAFPEIGALRVHTIDQDDVLRILKPLGSTRPQLARKLRQRIRTTLQWCQAHGHVATNVAGETIDGTLPAMPAVKAHFRALPWAEVGAALDAVRSVPGVSPNSRLCLEILVLTAARSGEALGAAWDEIDLIAREWRIPAERMKTGVAHAVPPSTSGNVKLCNVHAQRGHSVARGSALHSRFAAPTSARNQR